MADHHYVPQFLLRAWADNKGYVRAYFYVEEIGEAKDGRKNVRSICQEEDLYTYAQMNGAARYSPETEFFTREIDNPASVAYQRLMSDGIEALTWEQRMAWARFLISLAIRRPEIVRDRAPSMLRMIIDQAPMPRVEGLQDSDPETLAALIDHYFPGRLNDAALDSMIGLIRDNRKAAYVAQMKWWTRRIEGHELLLGDSPLLTRPEHHRRNGIPLNDPTTLLILPIAPDRVFFASSAAQIRHDVRLVHPTKLARQLNVGSIIKCFEHVYGTRRTNLLEWVARRFEEKRIASALAPRELSP